MSKKKTRKKIPRYRSYGHAVHMLKKYYGIGENKRFKNIKELRQTASDIYASIYTLGSGRINLKNIREQMGDVPKPKKSKTVEPIKPPFYIPEFEKVFIYYELLVENIFYIIEDIGKNVDVICPMILGKRVLRGGEKYNYFDTFKPFVVWANRQLMKIHSSNPELSINCRFDWKSVEQKGNRWEIELITCTEDGGKTDFGYRPEKELDSEASQALLDITEGKVTPKEEVKPTELKPIKEVTPSGIEEAKVQELRKTEEVKRAAIKKQADVDVLLKLRESELSQIKMFKELDMKDELKDSLAELKIINEKIKAYR